MPGFIQVTEGLGQAALPLRPGSVVHVPQLIGGRDDYGHADTSSVPGIKRSPNVPKSFRDLNEANGESVSDVVRRALERYIKR